MADPQEMPNTLTTLTLQEGVDALALGWKMYFGAAPVDASRLLVLAAQSILETGWFRAMHCYNFGNVKARAGGAWSWTYFACNEVLSPQAASEAVRQSTPAAPARISSYTKDGGAIVWFYPRHAACCFRAFASAAEGAADHVALLNSPRFESAWPFLDTGDVGEFARELYRKGYYTASPIQYGAGCSRIFTQLSADVAAGSIVLELDQVPIIGPDLAAQAIAIRDRSMRDDAFVEHEYPEVTIDEA
jgi:hypothetical protein